MKKRKDLILDHFDHDFPSISPSTKSRRLFRYCVSFSQNTLFRVGLYIKDADLCPVMDVVHDHPASVATLPVPPANATEERALVLYDPAKTPLLKSPTSPELSIVVNADLIPGLKDYLLSWGTAMSDHSVEDEARREKSSEVSNDCLAVVPWVAFRSPMACEEIVPETGKPLEAEEGEMMEMDEPYVKSSNEKAMEIGEKNEAAGSLSPWHQQHCMMLNLLQNTSTPIH